MTAKEILEMEYGNWRNIFTPRILGRGMVCKDTAYELSRNKGRTLSGMDLYGVCVVTILANGFSERLSGLCECFNSRLRAKEYIKSLKENPGRIYQEIDLRVGSWRCEHGQDYLTHVECWRKYSKGY